MNIHPLSIRRPQTPNQTGVPRVARQSAILICLRLGQRDPQKPITGPASKVDTISVRGLFQAFERYTFDPSG